MLKKDVGVNLAAGSIREKHDAVFQKKKKKNLLGLVYNLGLTLKGLYKGIVI